MNNTTEITANAIGYASVLAQTNDVMQFIQLGLAILSTLVILIPKLVKWYKNSIKDGKIDKEELEEFVDIIKESKEDK